MKRYFKHSSGKVFYSFNLSNGEVLRYVTYSGYAEQRPTVFQLICLYQNWFITSYIEISEVEFNSIFEI